MILKRLFFFFAIALFAISCTTKPKQTAEDKTPVSDTVVVAPPVKLTYGLPADSFNIEYHQVGRRDYLGKILHGYGIDYNTIDQLSRNYKEVFDVHKMKRGNTYAAFLTNDTVPQLRYFVYEKSVSDYVVYSFTDSAYIYAGHKKIRKEDKRGQGVIRSSLWNAMKENQLNPMLSVELSEIYAWTIDFFGIAKNDSFVVLYEEEYVDTVSIGISKIHAAVFTHLGHPYYAIPFVQDSVEHFFDEEGKSLRKAFLKAPLRYSRISSRFSNRRYHPVLKYYRAHHGVDYAAPRGTPVHTIGDGKIVAKGYQARGGGNYLKIKHNSVYTSVYMHLHSFAKGMATGKFVKQGDLIGTVGATGLATGPHLDFRIFMNGTPVDPLKVKAPPVEPIHEENRVAFEMAVKKSLAELNNH